MEEDIFSVMKEMFSGEMEKDLRKFLAMQLDVTNSTIATAKEQLEKLGKLDNELKTATIKNSLRRQTTELAMQVFQLEESKRKLEETQRKYGF